MNTIKRWSVIGGALAVFALAAAWAYSSWYAKPMSRISADLATARENIRRYEDSLEARRDVRAGLKEIAATTLGARVDTVEHRFRSMLTGIAQECGLRGVEVTSGAPERLRNPAGGARLDDRRLLASLRDQVDGFVIRGQLSATGSLEQVLRTMAMVRAQPWIGRVEGFRLTPEGRSRDRFSIRISVSTLFLPDLADTKEPEPVRASLSEDDRLAYSRIVAKNIFKEPAPVRVAQTAPTPAPPPQQHNPGPPPPPYHEWRLAGIAESPRQGVQAMLVNTRTNEYVFLGVGEKILDVTFIDGEGERAVFTHGQDICEVFNGQTLSQRKVIGTTQPAKEGTGISRR